MPQGGRKEEGTLKGTRVFVVVLAVILVCSTMAIAANGTVPSTVAVVTQGNGRPGALVTMDKATKNVLSDKGYAVVCGTPVAQALAKVGVQVRNGIQGEPVDPVVLNKERLLKVGDALGVDLVIGAFFNNNSHWHAIGGTHGSSELTVLVVDVKSREVVSPETALGKSKESDLGIGARVAVAGVGAAMATGVTETHWGWHHWAPSRWVGWAAIPAAFITFKSRCDREIEAMQSAAAKVLGGVIAKLSATTAKVEILSNQPAS